MGGSVSISAGDVTSIQSNRNGGSIEASAGSGVSGGNVHFSGGEGMKVDGGAVELMGGTGLETGGKLRLSSGKSSVGTSGAVLIESSSGLSSGDVSVRSGDSDDVIVGTIHVE